MILASRRLYIGLLVLCLGVGLTSYTHATPVVMDSQLSAGMSATIVPPVAHFVINGGDTAVASIAGNSFPTRALTAFFWDVPVSRYLMVFNHEFFGHGARFREFGHRDVFVFVDRPFPYSGNSPDQYSGFASGTPTRELTPVESSLIHSSGMAANLHLGKTIVDTAYVNGKLRYSDTLMALLSFSDPIFYTLMKIGDENGDPSRYVQSINSTFGRYDLAGKFVDGEDIVFTETTYQQAGEAELKTAQTMAFFSPSYLVLFYGALNSIITGDTVALPTFGEWEAFPDFHPFLSPFGLGYEFTLNLRRSEQFRFGINSNSVSRFQEFGYRSLVTVPSPWPGMKWGWDWDIWRQPSISDPSGSPARIGGLLRLKTQHRNEWLGQDVVVNVGVKTPGFRDPFPLDGAYFFELGINY